MGNSISHTRNPLPPTCPCLEVLDRVTSSRRALSLPFPLSSCKAIHLPVPQHIPLPCEASQSLSACPWESPFPSLPPCTACNVSNYLGKHCTVRQNSPFHGFSVTVNRIRIRPTLPPSLSWFSSSHLILSTFSNPTIPQLERTFAKFPSPHPKVLFSLVLDVTNRTSGRGGTARPPLLLPPSSTCLHLLPHPYRNGSAISPLVSWK